MPSRPWAKMPKSNRQVIARNMLNEKKYFVAAWNDKGEVRFIFEGIDEIDLARMQVKIAEHMEAEVPA